MLLTKPSLPSTIMLQTGNAIKQGSNWSKARLLFGKQDRQASKLSDPVTVTIAYLYTTFIYIHTLLSRPSHPSPLPCSLFSLSVFITRCCCFTRANSKHDQDRTHTAIEDTWNKRGRQQAGGARLSITIIYASKLPVVPVKARSK